MLNQFSKQFSTNPFLGQSSLAQFSDQTNIPVFDANRSIKRAFNETKFTSILNISFSCKRFFNLYLLTSHQTDLTTQRGHFSRRSQYRNSYQKRITVFASFTRRGLLNFFRGQRAHFSRRSQYRNSNQKRITEFAPFIRRGLSNFRSNFSRNY